MIKPPKDSEKKYRRIFFIKIEIAQPKRTGLRNGPVDLLKSENRRISMDARTRRTLAVGTLALAALTVTAAPPNPAAPTLQVVPGTFDFGWSPDNAKVTAEF